MTPDVRSCRQMEDVQKEKPKCSVDETHGVVLVRTVGTFEHSWTCLTCRTKLGRASDRDPSIPEKFEY